MEINSLTFRYRKYFPRELQRVLCIAQICLSDLQVLREIFPVSESQCGLINILLSFSQNILNSFLSVLKRYVLEHRFSYAKRIREN